MTPLAAGVRTVLFTAVFSMGLLAQAQQPSPAAPAAAAAQSSPENPTADAAKGLPAGVDPNKFSLGAEDVIAVRVWREPDLSAVHVIRPDGKITMPLVGEIPAAGLTPVKLGERITELVAKFVNDPQVTVSVQSVRSKRYYVTGEVFKPGAYPLVVPTTVFEALTLAGGFRDFANKKKITVVRGQERLRVNYNEIVKGKNPEQNVTLENGDHIIVP